MPWRLCALLLALSGCATATLVGGSAPSPADPGAARTVMVEPLFELAEAQTTTRTEYAQVPATSLAAPGFYGSAAAAPTTVAVTRQVEEKPFFARPQTLTQVHQALLQELQRRRPSWRVTSTSGAPALQGEVTVVRTIIDGNETIASNRALKNLAFGFGLVILPLQLFHVTPVEETVRVFGALERYAAGAEAVRQRLVKYPSQPDFAVNLAGVPRLRREFGLDVTYEEGLLADERPRPRVLLAGFVDRLATAVIALVEETPP